MLSNHSVVTGSRTSEVAPSINKTESVLFKGISNAKKQQQQISLTAVPRLGYTSSLSLNKPPQLHMLFQNQPSAAVNNFRSNIRNKPIGQTDPRRVNEALQVQNKYLFTLNKMIMKQQVNPADGYVSARPGFLTESGDLVGRKMAYTMQTKQITKSPSNITIDQQKENYSQKYQQFNVKANAYNKTSSALPSSNFMDDMKPISTKAFEQNSQTHINQQQVLSKQPSSSAQSFETTLTPAKAFRNNLYGLSGIFRATLQSQRFNRHSLVMSAYGGASSRSSAETKMSATASSVEEEPRVMQQAESDVSKSVNDLHFDEQFDQIVVDSLQVPVNLLTSDLFRELKAAIDQKEKLSREHSTYLSEMFVNSRMTAIQGNGNSKDSRRPFKMFPMHSESSNNAEQGFVTASVETQGWRNDMEDAIINCQITNPKGEKDNLFAVFDGHGGSAVSLFCQVALPRILEHNLIVLQDQTLPEELIKEALKKSIKDLDKIILSKQGHQMMTYIFLSGGEFHSQQLFSEQELTDEILFKSKFLPKLQMYQEKVLKREENGNSNLHLIGCTANICYLEQQSGKAYVANLGDSRSIHGSIDPQNKTFKISELSIDHKPGDAEETKRIKEAGYAPVPMGHGIVRIFNPQNPNLGGLNISRTIADFYYKRNLNSLTKDSSRFAISNESDVREIKFFDSSNEDATNSSQIDFILIGCDGIWEGGDFNDNPQCLPGQKEGVSVATYVGEQIEARLKTEKDRQKVAQAVANDLVSQIVSTRSPDQRWSLGANRPNEQESMRIRGGYSGFDNMSAILILKNKVAS